MPADRLHDLLLILLALNIVAQAVAFYGVGLVRVSTRLIASLSSLAAAALILLARLPYPFGWLAAAAVACIGLIPTLIFLKERRS